MSKNSLELTEDDVFEISKTTKLKALQLLNKRMKITCTTVSEVLQKEIYLNCILDQIIYAIQKGYTFNQTITIARFFKSLMDFLKENNSIQLNQYLLHLHDQLSLYNEFFTDTQMKQLLDYFKDTIIQHFELYKYCLSHARDSTVFEDTRFIKCPPEENFDAPLSNAKPFHLWDYEEKIKPIQAKRDDLQQYFLNERIRLEREEDSVKKVVEDKIEEFYENLNEENLSKLINSIALPILNVAGNILKSEIDEGRETILLNIEKRSIPRPDELGPMSLFLPKSLELSPKLQHRKLLRKSPDRSKNSFASAKTSKSKK